MVDDHTFNEYYENYKRICFSIYHKYRKSMDINLEASDIARYCIFKALRSFNPTKAQFSTLIFTVTKNECLNMVKQQKIKSKFKSLKYNQQLIDESKILKKF